MVTTVGWPFLRWSRSRRAYVLRVVGRTHGPVLKPKPAKPTGRFTRDPDRQQANPNPYELYPLE